MRRARFRPVVLSFALVAAAPVLPVWVTICWFWFWS